jgi:hypothetical protein
MAGKDKDVESSSEAAGAIAANKTVVARLLTMEARGAAQADFDAAAALLRLKPLSTLGSAILKMVFAFPPVTHTLCLHLTRYVALSPVEPRWRHEG